MIKTCKDCKNYNPKTFICKYRNTLTLEKNWCFGYTKKEERKENLK